MMSADKLTAGSGNSLCFDSQQDTQDEVRLQGPPEGSGSGPVPPRLVDNPVSECFTV